MTAAKIGSALVATHNLADYAGSEIFTLELATALRKMGWQVMVTALLPGEPMLSEFKRHGFQIVNLLTDDLLIRDVKFDLVWIHHTPVFYELLIARKIEAKNIIYCSLSHFEPLEAPPSNVELLDLLLAHSEENKNLIKKDYKLEEDQIIVFPNAAPKNYLNCSRSAPSLQLTRLAVVSNHPPSEVLDVVKILQNSNIIVEHIGLNGIKMLVGPGLLLKYDAVITVGKTVIYSFALNISVYCYDHFGGPGWLTDDNFELSRINNFSGRGFEKKPSEVIAFEIINGYQKSLLQLKKFRTHAETFHDLEKNLQKLLIHPKIFQSKPISLVDDIHLLKQHARYIRLAKTLSIREMELAARDREILRLKTSLSWRLTAPFRLIYNFLLRIIGEI